jgi:hypothetical protein
VVERSAGVVEPSRRHELTLKAGGGKRCGPIEIAIGGVEEAVAGGEI